MREKIKNFFRVCDQGYGGSCLPATIFIYALSGAKILELNSQEIKQETITGKIRESVRLIAIEHLHEALRAGLNHEAMRHVIAAIRVLER